MATLRRNSSCLPWFRIWQPSKVIQQDGAKNVLMFHAIAFGNADSNMNIMDNAPYKLGLY